MDTILGMANGILRNKFVAYPLAFGLALVGVLTIFFFISSIVVSYRHAKKTGEPTSWFKIFDDIKWTVYCWSDRDKAYVMSLPRFIYLISAILIIYVVVTNKTEMLTPLLGFNLSAMVSYTSKRYFEGKEYKEELDREALQSKLDEINKYADAWNAGENPLADDSSEDGGEDDDDTSTDEEVKSGADEDSSDSDDTDVSGSAKAVLD